MTARDHNKLLGIFFLVNGGLSAFTGVLIAIIYGGIGTMVMSTAKKSEDQMFGGIFIGAAIFVGLLVLVFAGFYFFTGWKVYKEQPIGRVLGIVASCLSILSFPLGTALGVYGLWFLFGDQGKNFYEGGEMVRSIPGNPPPPNSWQ